MSARDIWAALGGKRLRDGAYLVHCPCPNHGKGRGDKTPSLGVADGDHTLLVKCHGHCDTADVLDELRARGLLEDKGAWAPRVAATGTAKQQVPDTRAAELWAKCSPTRYTPVETYLRRRCIDARIPATLRFHREKYQNERLPVMVAAVQDTAAKVVAVQRTYLTWAGEKAAVDIPRITTGTMGGGAVRLARISVCTKVLGLAEGVETAMSASEIWGGLPVWATLGAGRLPKIEIPSHISEIHIYADSDGPGQQAAEDAVKAYAPRRVIVRTPPKGVEDWNHFRVLQKLKAAAIA